ncbi:MAG: hypothetical protein KY475_19890 [Planctomycetes bacterium]|nr:hypothetical protein [Planctomycetota bacterium]
MHEPRIMIPERIASRVRTVTHTAEYFEELKSFARDLAGRGAASGRGYFTPTEEEDLRALLISYWQARGALLELITSVRLEAEQSPQDRAAAFLTGFAGALVLIDAARFLRETVHDRPVVREKLNEPDPAFGIPAGLYDTVQQSLVSPRNAWRLYRAMRYFEKQEAELRTLAGPELAAVLAIIDRLRHRLDVSAAQFARARLRARAAGVLRALMSDGLSRALYNLQKLGGNLLSDKYLKLGHRPALPSDVAEQVRSLLLPGDVLVVRKEHALTNYFLPGFWPHAALYLGDAAALEELKVHEQDHARQRWSKLLHVAGEGPWCVLESMKDGVQFRSLSSPFGSDSIVVLRPQLSREQIAQGLARVMAHEGKPYDFDFDFRRSDRLVCTEVVYRAYDGLGDMQFPLTRRAGRPTLSGSDLIGLGIERKRLDPIAVFVPGAELITGDGVDAVLRTRQGLAAPAP